jgi:phosphinothricin acetyltransferase
MRPNHGADVGSAVLGGDASTREPTALEPRAADIGIVRMRARPRRQTLQPGIVSENLASIALHRSHGFRIVGVRERIAELRGRWPNMLLLERREGAGSRQAPAAEPFWEVGHHACH